MKIAHAAAAVSGMTLLSRLAGYARDILAARYSGSRG